VCLAYSTTESGCPPPKRTKSKHVGTFWPRPEPKCPPPGAGTAVSGLPQSWAVSASGDLTPGEFLDLIGAANLIPGPNSTEVALYIGLRQGGWRGFLLAGAAFIGPAMVLVLLCAWAYGRFGTLRPVKWVFGGVAPVVVAVVAHALWAFGKAALRTPLLGLVGAAALVARLAGVSEIPILVGAGLLAIAGGRLPLRGRGLASVELTTAAGLFLFFLKVGAFVYGSGYVLLAFLQRGLVGAGWLTQSQLLDASPWGRPPRGPCSRPRRSSAICSTACPAPWPRPRESFSPRSSWCRPARRSCPACRRVRRPGVFSTTRSALHSPLAAGIAGFAVVLLLARGSAPRGSSWAERSSVWPG
jgi:chromate transport protein ChrA